MNADAEAKLRELRADFEEVTGEPFSYFYCPVLFRDDNVELCQGHIVNKAFRNVGRQWTVQRADVDRFYGSYFESEFVDTQHREQMRATPCVFDKSLATRFRPAIMLKGRPVPYYYAPDTTPTPRNHSKVQFEGDHGTIKLRLKMTPKELEATDHTDWEIRIERDLRLPALVSLLKVAHLTLFRMLGYQYVLSAAGYFMGRSILGEFFLENEHLDRATVIKNARSYFAEFSNLVRPVISHKPLLEGTAADHRLYICETASHVPWAFMIFARTTGALHAVIVPIFEHPEGISRFMSFLKSDGGRIEGLLARYKSGQFEMWPNPTTFLWPTGGFR